MGAYKLSNMEMMDDLTQYHTTHPEINSVQDYLVYEPTEIGVFRWKDKENTIDFEDYEDFIPLEFWVNDYGDIRHGIVLQKSNLKIYHFYGVG